MPARASQPASYPGGKALIEVIGPQERSDGLIEICLLHQMDGPDKTKHLDPRTPADPWKSAVFWFAPDNVVRADGRLSFDLNHGITAHLRPNMPYILRLRGGGAPAEERLVWKPFRGKSTPPVWEPPQGPQWPASGATDADSPESSPGIAEAPDRSAEQEPEQPVFKDTTLTATRDDRTPPNAGSQSGTTGAGMAAVGKIAAGLLLLAALGGGLWFFLADRDRQASQPTDPVKPPQIVAPAPPTTVEEARKLVQQGVAGGDAYALGQRYREAKALDGAFLLFRHAAEHGSAEAAIAVGEMYDPATHSAQSSPLPSPNPTQAAEWYRRAAETGNAEGQYRYGRLLMNGKTDDPQGADTGLAWLRKAADQGHAMAKEALPK